MDYSKLPYTYKFIPDKTGYFFVSVEELPGCVSQGEDIKEAWENIREAQELWISTAIEDGISIPVPKIIGG